MKLDTLDALNDDELQAVISRCQDLLKARDEQRKAKAMADARALLASVGLSLNDIGRGKATRAGKPPAYRGGHRYQHPADKTLVWNAKGQKPGWLRELEKRGGRALELPPEATGDTAASPLKKTG